MMHLINPLIPEQEDPAMKDLTDDQRLTLAIIQSVIYFACVAVAIFICGLLHGCTTPRAVEEHHHHHYEADTAAVRAHVDARLTSWHEDMTRFLAERLEQFASQQQQSEHEMETVTETITVSLDSVGREIRTEQRTITRDVTRELQQQEQRITREYEERLQVAVDSVCRVWERRYDSLAAHVAMMDSSFVRKTPVGDTRPWYRRWWEDFRAAFFSLLAAAVIFLTRGLWMPLLKRIAT